MDTTIISGHVVFNDATETTTANGRVINFKLSVNKGRDKDGNFKPSKIYHCELWAKNDKQESRYFRIGKYLTLEGEVTAEPYINKEGIAVANLRLNIKHFSFCGEKTDGK